VNPSDPDHLLGLIHPSPLALERLASVFHAAGHMPGGKPARQGAEDGRADRYQGGPKVERREDQHRG
jgi:hypothetical protein